MKASRFNHYVVSQNSDEAFIFNTFTSKLLQTKARYIPAIRDIHLLSREEPNSLTALAHLKEKLQGAGLVVPANTDEIEVLRRYYRDVFLNPDTLHITFAPSLSCNFRCTYCCLESLPQSRQVMDGEKTENFIDFVTMKLTESGCKNLFVVWFGGEPMLQADKILKVGQKLQHICNLKNVTFFSEMYTNGSLLTPLFVQKAREFGLNTISVTIDGTEHVHNSKRPYRTGRGSFDTILKNLDLIIPVAHTVNLGTTIHRSTRVSDIRKMIHEFAGRGWFDGENRVKICITKAVGWSFEKQIMDIPTHEEYGRFHLDLVRLALQDAIVSKSLAAFVTGLPGPGAFHFFCHARKRWSFSIDPMGYFYGCTYLLGRKEYAEGSISENFDQIRAAEKRKPWLEFDISRRPLQKRKCSTCNLLPLCYSRCCYPLMNPAEFKGDTEYDCVSWKYMLDQYLPLYTEYRKQYREMASKLQLPQNGISPGHPGQYAKKKWRKK